MERNEVFYDWLRAKLFNVEDDKSREEWLTASVKELAEVLAKNPHEVRCYTLVALDANIPVDNLRVVDTYDIVRKHWTSVEGKYSEAPRSILRGVILSALYQLGKADRALCRIIYYTASGYAQFVHFGSEQTIIDRILLEFGRSVEDEALTEWSLAEVPAVPTFAQFKLKDFKLGSATVDSDSLTVALETAAGKDPKTNHGPENGSQYWGPYFSKIASAGIATAIETTIKSFGESLSTTTLQNEINKFFTGVHCAPETGPLF